MVTLVLNSPQVDADRLRRLAGQSVLIGVDGGLNAIVSAGLRPDWAVGDFDSVRPELLEQLRGKTRILRYPVEKDYTDIELALKLTRLFRPCTVNVLGLEGGHRFDHQLVNSVMLSNLAESGCSVEVWSRQQKLIFTKGFYKLFQGNGRMFSIFTLSGPVTASIWGAKYSGNRLLLVPGSGYGLGNEITARHALVGIRGGVACISQWQEN